MAGIVEAVATYLKAQDAITSLVGTRVYEDEKPRNPTLPCIVVYDISADSHEHLGGSSGLTTDRVQIDCVDDDAGDADTIREAVRKKMQGHRGTMGSKSTSGCSHGGSSSSHDYPTTNRDQHEHTKAIDFLITYSEEVPS